MSDLVFKKRHQRQPPHVWKSCGLYAFDTSHFSTFGVTTAYTSCGYSYHLHTHIHTMSGKVVEGIMTQVLESIEGKSHNPEMSTTNAGLQKENAVSSTPQVPAMSSFDREGNSLPSLQGQMSPCTSSHPHHHEYPPISLKWNVS